MTFEEEQLRPESMAQVAPLSDRPQELARTLTVVKIAAVDAGVFCTYHGHTPQRFA